MPKKKKIKKILPRRGPPTNLRQAGAHEDKKQKALDTTRDKERDDLIAMGSWAYEEE
jgi:hypothetical protein